MQIEFAELRTERVRIGVVVTVAVGPEHAQSNTAVA